MRSRLFVALSAVLLLSGCASMPNPWAGAAQPQPAVSNTAGGAAVGAVGGAVAGAIVGGATGSDPRVAALIGAGVGALSGAAIGTYMDQEEADLRAQLQASGVTVTRQGQQLVLTMPAAITFDTDEARVKPGLTGPLASVGRLLKKYDRTVIDVYGYTDAQGSDAHNKNLSQRRAVAVAALLAAQGVDQRRFFIQGKGEADPVAANDTEIGRAQNRRVEIQLSPIT